MAGLQAGVQLQHTGSQYRLKKTSLIFIHKRWIFSRKGEKNA